MKVSVHLLSQSRPIEYTDVDNAYTKGVLDGVYHTGSVDKFPLCCIFRVKEDYK